GVKAPAATGCAIVTAVSGSVSEARRSHAVVSGSASTTAATHGETPKAKTVATTNRISSLSLVSAGVRFHRRRVYVLQMTAGARLVDLPAGDEHSVGVLGGRGLRGLARGVHHRLRSRHPAGL